MLTRNALRLSMFTAVLLVAIGAHGARAQTCVWEGKAPACNGDCRPGYTLAERDKSGDGKKCVTGTKAYCCKTSDVIIRGSAPFCNGKCKTGEETLGESEFGPNGNKCQTGKAAICRLAIN